VHREEFQSWLVPPILFPALLIVIFVAYALIPARSNGSPTRRHTTSAHQLDLDAG
jgi:hypothetical protein